MSVLFYNCTIITGEKVITKGYFVVSSGKIVDISKGHPDFSQYEKSDKVNLNGKWVMPGLINTHCHSGMTLLRGFGDDLPLQEWLQTKMWPMEAKFNHDIISKASSLALLEMLKTGTTTFLDMYIHMDTVAEVVEKSGQRAVLTRGIIGLCSETEQEEKLQEAVNFAVKWNGQADGRITTMLSPHSPYTCPPEFIRSIVSEARRLHIPLHTHMSETLREVEENVSKYKVRPVEHLANLGFFDGPAHVAHAVHITKEEIKFIAKKNVSISHNPASNLKLGSGIANITEMLEEGVLVSVGTDSVASNNNLDLFQEIRLAALVQKGITQNPTALPAKEALKMVTSNGAKALHLPHTGSLEVGNDADFITIDPRHAHLSPSGEGQVLSHLIYSASGADVSDVYVKGQCLVKEKEVLSLDEEKIIYEANEAFNDLLG